MKTFDMFGNHHEYRKKWDPGSPEDYDEHWGSRCKSLTPRIRGGLRHLTWIR